MPRGWPRGDEATTRRPARKSAPRPVVEQSTLVARDRRSSAGSASAPPADPERGDGRLTANLRRLHRPRRPRWLNRNRGERRKVRLEGRTQWTSAHPCRASPLACSPGSQRRRPRCSSRRWRPVRRLQAPTRYGPGASSRRTSVARASASRRGSLRKTSTARARTSARSGPTSRRGPDSATGESTTSTGPCLTASTAGSGLRRSTGVTRGRTPRPCTRVGFGQGRPARELYRSGVYVTRQCHSIF